MFYTFDYIQIFWFLTSTIEYVTSFLIDESHYML